MLPESEINPVSDLLVHQVASHLDGRVGPKLSCILPKREVFRISQNKTDKVVKIRPGDDKGWREVRMFRLLMDHYGVADQSGVYVFNGSVVMVMPDFGVDLMNLSQDLDTQEYNGCGEATKFTPETVNKLINDAIADQKKFFNDTGMVHGDLYHKTGPNNVVYNCEREKLYFVDPEAISPADPRTLSGFEKQIRQIGTWMVRNLTDQPAERCK